MIAVQEYDPAKLKFQHFYHAFGLMWQVFVLFDKKEDAEEISKVPDVRVLIVKFPDKGPHTLRHPHSIEGFL